MQESNAQAERSEFEKWEASPTRVGMTRGHARAAAIALMVIGAHEDDDPDNRDIFLAYCALAKAGGIKR